MEPEFNSFFSKSLSYRMITGDDEAVEKYASILDWTLISRELQGDRLERFVDHLCWPIVSKRTDLSKRFIEKYKDQLHWQWITANYAFSTTEIARLDDYINWSVASKTQVLTAEMIEQHRDEVDWVAIARCQHLSDLFWINNSSNIRWRDLSGFQYVSDKVRAHYRYVQPPRIPAYTDTVSVFVLVSYRPAMSIWDKILRRRKIPEFTFKASKEISAQASLSLQKPVDRDGTGLYAYSWSIKHSELKELGELGLQVSVGHGDNDYVDATTSIYDSCYSKEWRFHSLVLKNGEEALVDVKFCPDRTKAIFRDLNEITIDKNF